MNDDEVLALLVKQVADLRREVADLRGGCEVNGIRFLKCDGCQRHLKGQTLCWDLPVELRYKGLALSAAGMDGLHVRIKGKWYRYCPHCLERVYAADLEGDEHAAAVWMLAQWLTRYRPFNLEDRFASAPQWDIAAMLAQPDISAAMRKISV